MRLMANKKTPVEVFRGVVEKEKSDSSPHSQVARKPWPSAPKNSVQNVNKSNGGDKKK